MGQVNTDREEELLMAERAADWLLRLESGSSKEQAAFIAWLKESPRHVREILLAATWDKALDSIDSKRLINLDSLMSKEPTIVAMRRDATSPINSERKRPRFALRWAASFLATAAIVAWLFVWAPTMPTNTYRTAIGEQRAVELDDGSVIHLNALSRVKINFSESVREIHLLEGQAIFNVKQDAARPFRVIADQALIQALGTQFDVRRREHRTTVAVIEGLVRISAAASSRPSTAARLESSTTLTAGEAASIVNNGSVNEQVTPPATINITEVTAWRQRRLVFRKDTLADMAAEFNRYNRLPQIRIEGGALQMKPFNGVFDADDPESLIRFLEQMDNITVVRDGDAVVIRER